MHVISKKKLIECWTQYPSAEQPLRAWHAEATKAQWKKPTDVKQKFGSASILPDNRVVFNIGGNKYRLVVKIHYNIGVVYVRWVGPHTEYDRINAEEI